PETGSRLPVSGAGSSEPAPQPEPSPAPEEPEAEAGEAEEPIAEPEPEPRTEVEPEPEPAPVAEAEEEAEVEESEPAAREEAEAEEEPEVVDDFESYDEDEWGDDDDDWAEDDAPPDEEEVAPSMAASVEAIFARIKADTEAANAEAHDDEGVGGVAVLADRHGDDHDAPGHGDDDDRWSDDHDDLDHEDHADLDHEDHDDQDDLDPEDHLDPADDEPPAQVPIESYDRGAVPHLLPEQFDDGGAPGDHHVDAVDHVDDHDHDHAEHDYDDEPAGDEDLVARRDAALARIEQELNRRLKRVLADEQNEVLDLLRRTKPSSADELLAALGGHTARYGDAARESLGQAAGWGASSVGGEPDGSYEALAVELAQAIVEPLRERIAGSFRDSGDIDEVTGRLRALYREWKGQRIAAAVRHYAVAAYAQGAYGAVPDGTPLRWLVDRSSDPCPDADDNALAGAVCKGEAFPTGDHCPPAHLGCRCMVVPAE
ncbi:MAG TPA: hypothetical protein VIL36_16120, partial [Acidimicrobiales bacterium]